MPKTPISTGTMPKPSNNSACPKVKRGAPMTGSIPTIAINSPTIADIRALTKDLPASPVTSESPTTIRQKNSGGPNLSAKRASGRATTTKPMVATVPPTKEPIAATASAEPARPLLAISYPSMHVMAEAASPGTFTSTEVMVPPYMVP